RRAESFGNPKENPWNFFGEFLWGISLGNFFGGSWERCRRFYGPSAGLSIRIRPLPSGRRRASVVTRRRSCAALAQGVRFVTDAGRASRAIARKRGIDEAGLARHIRRGSQPLIHHLSDPQGSERMSRAVHRDGS